MKRILIRSGKSPLRVATPPEIIRRNLLGTNTGNLIFSDAVHKLLLTPGTEVESSGFGLDPDRAAAINDEYDVFVVPLANAFRPDFQPFLDRISALIEQLTIPVVVLGVGAQAGHDYDTSSLAPLASSVKRFASAVLERSASIGIRGELTADYLTGLGVDARHIDIIGCPSMFLYGDRLPSIRPADIDSDSRVAMNLSPDALGVGDLMGIVDHVWSHYPNLTYYAQNTSDAEVLFWGDTTLETGEVDLFPRQLSHILFQEGKVKMPLEPTTWIKELGAYDFVFGTRIHGNVAGLLAGTPAVVLTHDSRTLELCRYFDIPYRELSGLPSSTDPKDLYEQADFSAMAEGHPERFGRLVAFLDRHDLKNTYTHGDGGASFEAELATLDLAASLSVWDGQDDGHLRYRMSWLRERALDARERARKQARDSKHLRKQLATTTRELALVRDELAALTRRTAELEARTASGVASSLKRRLRGTFSSDHDEE